jgi:hypothetical protein
MKVTNEEAEFKLKALEVDLSETLHNIDQWIVPDFTLMQFRLIEKTVEGLKHLSLTVSMLRASLRTGKGGDLENDNG